jgi:hypothetical protein
MYVALIRRHNIIGEDQRAVTYFDVKPPPGCLPFSSNYETPNKQETDMIFTSKYIYDFSSLH